MDWVAPAWLLAMLAIVPLLWWFDHGSLRPLSPARRRALLAVRTFLCGLVLLVLARPAMEQSSNQQAAIFVLDHSQSQGEEGMKAARRRAETLAGRLPSSAFLGCVSAGQSTVVRQLPQRGARLADDDPKLMKTDGGQTDLAAAVSLALGLFPPETSRRLVLVTDGQQTRGDLEAAAREAALRGVRIDAAPIAGQARPDVRLLRLVASRSRSHEGAAVELRADVESSLAGRGTLRLFENGIEVESRPLELTVGQQASVSFRRAPEQRNLYTYRVRVEGFPGDTLPENDEAMTLVDVRGRPLLLYVEGEPAEAHYLSQAMAKEGIRLELRSPETFPGSLQELAGYDGVLLSDIPAHKLGEGPMTLVRDYVEKLGGGLVMIGGKNSFGAGGYYRTPIEEVLPVKMKAPDTEERFATALMLVLDRSGSMTGQKVEICKSAAIATVELLEPKDHVGVIAFDSEPHWVVPMTLASSKGEITSRILTINADGGTNIYPALSAAHQALQAVPVKVRHVIVLTDGQTMGGGYEALASSMHGEGITVSTVAVGPDADTQLLQRIATSGGGTFYQTFDPSTLPRIFTQDAMVHVGRLVREEAFAPKQVERHLMLKGCPMENTPELLGYVKTRRKATAQVPMVTDQGDPLLAHWQFGLGKVTAFTSDAKSRWAALWITGWPGYSQFWAQVLRETARRPQGHGIDLRLEEAGARVEVLVDVLEDPAHYKNDASVSADVYCVAAAALGSRMKPVAELAFDQVGPGKYHGRFTPEEAGGYLVRARSGAEVVSAGMVHSVSGEAATGRVDEDLLGRVCRITGGTLLKSADDRLPEVSARQPRYVELAPLLLRALILLFLLDVAIRRWENILGMVSMLRREA
jgi:Ca-activated chloride channel family protein